MKKIQSYFLILTGALFFGAAVPVKNHYLLAKDYSVSIHGTSNLHAWDEKVGIVNGESAVSANKDGTFDLETINIRLNVHSIKSDMGAIMNNNTYKALKADSYPEIIFALSAPIKSLQTKAPDKIIAARGNLSIAGVTRAVDMQVKIFIKEPGKLVFEGSQAIKMTDYAINPPTALLGRLKTGNEITIKFRITLVITTPN